MTFELLSDAPAASSVQLGGRRFTVIDHRRMNTLLFEYLDKLDRQAGLSSLLAATPEDEAGDDLLVLLRTAVIDSGITCELVAGSLMPVGMTEAEWTPAVAVDVCQHLQRCTGVEDVLAIQQHAMDGISSFFLRWLELNAISQSYFSQAKAQLKAASTAAR